MCEGLNYYTLNKTKNIRKRMIVMSRSEDRKCTNCHYYDKYEESDKLNPDKTITRGEVKMEFCCKGMFELKDCRPCEMWKETSSYEKMYGTSTYGMAFAYYHTKLNMN
jgi:hypothetical protein